MPEPTVGDLARFLVENPGWHDLGNFRVKHEHTFKIGDDWITGDVEIRRQD